MSLEDALKANTEALNRLALLLANPLAVPPDVAVPLGEELPPESPQPSLTYEADVRKPFLNLLNTKREAAMKLLADLGVQNLKGFENQPEKFAELSQKIQEVQNAEV